MGIRSVSLPTFHFPFVAGGGAAPSDSRLLQTKVQLHLLIGWTADMLLNGPREEPLDESGINTELRSAGQGQLQQIDSENFRVRARCLPIRSKGPIVALFGDVDELGFSREFSTAASHRTALARPCSTKRGLVQ